jgi:hypothetical protein
MGFHEAVIVTYTLVQGREYTVTVTLPWFVQMEGQCVWQAVYILSLVRVVICLGIT